MSSNCIFLIHEKIQNELKHEKKLRELGFEKPKLIRSTNEYPPDFPKINLLYDKERFVDKLY